MAIIPYGYRIENGNALPDPEKAEKLNHFIGAYLDGASIITAKKLSNVGLSPTALKSYLRKGTYQGTEYYPPIVPEGTQERILAERARRTHKGYKKVWDDLPVRSRFRMDKPKGPCRGNASDTAAFLYDLIIPVDDGREKILPGELKAIKEWADHREGSG